MLYSDPFEELPSRWRFGRAVDLALVPLMVPVLPGKIVGIGRSYAEHARELGNEPANVATAAAATTPRARRSQDGKGRRAGAGDGTVVTFHSSRRADARPYPSRFATWVAEGGSDRVRSCRAHRAARDGFP